MICITIKCNPGQGCLMISLTFGLKGCETTYEWMNKRTAIYSEPAALTSTPSTGCLLLLSCGWTPTELIFGFTLITACVGNRSHIQVDRKWNPTENCFMITYHSSFMVHWWVLVHFGLKASFFGLNRYILYTFKPNKGPLQQCALFIKIHHIQDSLLITYSPLTTIGVKNWTL